jgi:1-acyl-sn-glycerol-3-phosphate acyltransferase
MNRYSRYKAWAFSCVLLFLLLFTLLRQPWKEIETNILMFLPPGELTQNQQILAELDRSRSRQSSFLLCAPTFKEAQLAADFSVNALEKSGLFAKVNGRIQGDYALKIEEFYKTYLGVGQDSEITKILKQPDVVTNLLQRQQTLLMQVGHLTSQLQFDPLLLKTQFNDLPALKFGAFLPQQDWLTLQNEDEKCIFLSAKNSSDPFDGDYQDQFLSFFNHWQTQLTAKSPQTRLLALSLIRFAALARQDIQNDLVKVTLISLAGIFLLLKFVFRGFRPLWSSQIPLIAGTICGFSAAILIYSKIHLVALALGATLTGVAIDYVFHYLSQWRFQHEDWDSTEILKQILPGINQGLLTSLIGYTAFFLAPVEGIQQTAVFAIFGLTGAYISLLIYFPLIFKQPSTRQNFWLLNFTQKSLAYWSRFGLPASLFFVFCAIIYLSFGLPKINDDIRTLNSLPDNLKLEVKQFAQLSEIPDFSRFFLVTAKDSELLLQRVEFLAERLQKLQEEEKISGYVSAIEIIPSKKRQLETYQATAKVFSTERKKLESYLLSMGFTPAQLQQYFAMWEKEAKILTLSEWLANPVSAPWSDMWVKQKKQFASTVYLSVNFDQEAVKKLEGEGISLIDRTTTISEAFGRHRRSISKVLLAAYLLIFYLLWINQGLKNAFWIIFPPLAGAINLLVWLKFFALDLNLFHMLSMILILGIGIDYSIFYYYCDKKELAKTTIAVFASLLTTLLAFGVLGFSSVPALKAIGLSLSVGLCSAFLISSITKTDYRSFLPDMPEPLIRLDRTVRTVHNTVFCGLSFVIFAFFGALILFFLFPLVKLCTRDRIKRLAYRQYLIYLGFRLYYVYFDLFGLIKGELLVKELNAVKDKKMVIVANHPTLLDFVLLTSALPNAVCLVKAAVWKNPFISKLAKEMGYIPFKSSQETIDLCLTRLEEGFPLLIFPEGTRSPVGGLGKFSKGAAYIALKAGVDIMPVSLSISEHILMKNWKWWDVPPYKVTMRAEFHQLFPTKGILAKYDGNFPLASRKVTKELVDFFNQVVIHNNRPEKK